MERATWKLLCDNQSRLQPQLIVEYSPFICQILKSPHGRFDPKTLCAPAYSGVVSFVSRSEVLSGILWSMKCLVIGSNLPYSCPFFFPSLTFSWEATVPEWWRMDRLPPPALFIPWRTEPIFSTLLHLEYSSSSFHSHSVQAQPAVLPLLCSWTETCC